MIRRSRQSHQNSIAKSIVQQDRTLDRYFEVFQSKPIVVLNEQEEEEDVDDDEEDEKKGEKFCNNNNKKQEEDRCRNELKRERCFPTNDSRSNDERSFKKW